MCWCALLLFTGLAVGLAWQQATVRSIPECAAHVELALSGEVLAANRKSTDEWLLDVRVVGHGTLRTRNILSGQSCQGLLGKRLLLRWRAEDMTQAGERWLFTLKLRVPWGLRTLAVLTIVAGFWPAAILLPGTSKLAKGC